MPISKPTHPKKAVSNPPGKPPVWWAGGNYIRIKKYGSGRKHKLGKHRKEMVPDRG